MNHKLSGAAYGNGNLNNQNSNVSPYYHDRNSNTIKNNTHKRSYM